jgi:hypothetical protein
MSPDFLGYSDQFDGTIFARGLDLLEGTVASPPDESRIRWVDLAGVPHSDLLAYFSGTTSNLSLTAGSATPRDRALAILGALATGSTLAWFEAEARDSTNTEVLRANLNNAGISRKIIDEAGASDFHQIGGGRAGVAVCSANLTLAVAFADVAGCTFTAPFSGNYLVTGIFDVNYTVAGGGNMSGRCLVNGVAQGSLCLQGVAVSRNSVSQQWLVTVTAGQIVKLQANKSIAAGTIIVQATHSTLGWHPV